MKRKVMKSVSYPETERGDFGREVQARRMNGINKLLQKFDDEIQLIKIHQQLKSRASKVWVNSHRDHSIYKRMIPSIDFYQDDEPGFLGTIDGHEECLVTCTIWIMCCLSLVM